MARRIEEDPAFPGVFSRPRELDAVGGPIESATRAALAFAAKEAVLKVLRVDDADGMLFRDIELVAGLRWPGVRLHDRALAVARMSGTSR